MCGDNTSTNEVDSERHAVQTWPRAGEYLVTGTFHIRMSGSIAQLEMRLHREVVKFEAARGGVRITVQTGSSGEPGTASFYCEDDFHGDYFVGSIEGWEFDALDGSGRKSFQILGRTLVVADNGAIINAAGAATWGDAATVLEPPEAEDLAVAILQAIANDTCSEYAVEPEHDDCPEEDE